ncbi:MAG: MotA/TolQ/ExbB proton channel family protein [Lachnospiraceae bacterium]|nr:MotA/TolQ/ExbB proton channel family protein [Lachnospiraceae bacterium]
MDIASLVGLLACFALMMFGIIQSGGVAAIMNFVDVPSALITFGGAFMCVFAQNSIPSFVGGFKTFALIFKVPENNIADIISNIINLSNVARKEGLLSLEEAAGNIEDAFMKKGIMLVVDGTDPELVRGILETEMINTEDRHKGMIGFWDTVAAMGPAWGMIGTLIGLVNMLQNLSDPSSIGPSMAVALITTLYGSLLANWICAPVAGKLKVQNADEMMAMQIEIEGLLSIQAGENPRVIEEKLKSFLSPAAREEIGGASGGEG